MSIFRTTTVMLLGLILVSAGVRAEGDACFSDWSAATILIRSEGLATVDELTKLAPAKLGGVIVRTTLCETGDGFVYKLVVRDKGGQLKLIAVDARNPFDR